jgi:chromosome segregation ATPase
VEYIGLIPILTKALQEQQLEIEDNKAQYRSLEQQNQLLERRNKELENRLARLESLVEQIVQQQSEGENSTSTAISNARLEQNQPNPFGNSTSIAHDIPSGVLEARLEISDANGRIIRSLEIPNRGQGQTVLETQMLTDGTYFYSLILDGKVVDTKKMIAIK